jgi:hypothetical protein
MPSEKENGLSPEELERQEAEALPDREVMSTIDAIPLGRLPAEELTESPLPDDVA